MAIRPNNTTMRTEATYAFLTPDQSGKKEAEKHPFVEHSAYLALQNDIKVTKVPVNLQPWINRKFINPNLAPGSMSKS